MNCRTDRRLPRFQAPVRLAVSVLAAGLVVAACGGGSGSSTSTTSASPGAGSGQAAFLKCLRKYGVKLPSGAPTAATGQPPGSGTPPAGFGQGKSAKAFQACKKLAPSGFGAGGPGGNASALAAFDSCLRDHGVKPGGTGLSALAALRKKGGKAEKAVKTCQPLLPQGLRP